MQEIGQKRLKMVLTHFWLLNPTLMFLTKFALCVSRKSRKSACGERSPTSRKSKPPPWLRYRWYSVHSSFFLSVNIINKLLVRKTMEITTSSISEQILKILYKISVYIPKIVKKGIQTLHSQKCLD